MLKEKINDLKKEIVEQSMIVKKMIEWSMDGLIKEDNDILKQVFDLEKRVNKNEIGIEELCIGLIALHSPEAKDLRTIIMMMKMNNDLERIGDLSVNIAESAQYLIKKPKIETYTNLVAMAEKTIEMFQDCVTSLINEDVELAKKVCIADDIVDEFNDNNYRVLLTYMLEDQKTIKRAIQINKISSQLERIADLATNIAEEVIYMVNGVVIMHHKNKKF